MAASSRLSERQKRAAAILLGVLFSLALLEILFRFLPVSESSNRLPVNQDNPVPRHEENRDFIYSRDPDFSIISHKHSNNYGFLNDQDYTAQAASPLMAVIGDSYVAAMEVENSQAFHGILSADLGGRGRVYSFGQSNAQLPTYLVYAEYVRENFHPVSMVFVIIANDYDESLLKYRTDPGFYYFDLSQEGEKGLVRIDYEPGPLNDLAKSSALIRYLALNVVVIPRLKVYWDQWLNKPTAKQTGNPEAASIPERVADSKLAVDEFLRVLPEYSGLSPENVLFVIDGERPDLYSVDGMKALEGTYISVMREYFMDQAAGLGYEVVDMQPLFIERHRQDGATFEFENDHHWNPLGHQLVAEAIANSQVYARTFGTVGLGQRAPNVIHPL